ncbi:hypothetical protein EDB84DRAFT_1446364 [Lactarius hengduanensis]|nr:hypothetical protein EDB84DRAFT_1446364 [Lactarius hengduanensis]
MPPHRRTFVDILTDDEKVLMDIAVRLVSALRYREKNLDTVEDAWYRKCISDELEDSETVFKKYDHRPDKPRIHPIITHVGDEWDSAKDDRRDPDVTVLDLDEMHRLCDEGAVENPSWNTQLHMKPLESSLAFRTPRFAGGSRLNAWTILQHPDPFSVDTGSGSITKPAPAPARDAPTVDKDVEMGDEDEGETPGKAKKAQKRPAVQSPTPARRETSRRKGASGSAIVESSPESEAEGLAPTKPLPAKPVPSAPAPVKPKARRRVSGVPRTGSGDEIPPPGPRKRSRGPQVSLTSPPQNWKTVPLTRAHVALAKSMVGSASPRNPRRKDSHWHVGEEVIERVDAMARAQTLHNTAMYDFVYNIDTMIRACILCGQRGQWRAVIGLEHGLGRMTLQASGVSDASEIPLDLVQDEPSRQRLRSRSAHSGTTSNAQSKAGSRQSSRGRK